MTPLSSSKDKPVIAYISWVGSILGPLQLKLQVYLKETTLLWVP